MTKNIKFLLIALFVSLPFWWSVNVLQQNLQDFFFWHKMSENPQILSAKASSAIITKDMGPIKKAVAEIFQTEAKSALSVWFGQKTRKKILFEKEKRQELPIASLTKLMSAAVVLEYYDPEIEVEIDKLAAEQPGNGAGKFKVGEKFEAKTLLYPMLMESNNSATLALAQIIGEKGFVEIMNFEAERLGLLNIYFANSTGLDPDKLGDPLNYSTAEDLIWLTKYLIGEKPLIFEILSLPELSFHSPDGIFHHHISNTNELLGEISGIIGGKTGWTPMAQGCLLLALKSPKNNGFLINVILGSEDRFEEMKKLISWAKKSYYW